MNSNLRNCSDAYILVNEIITVFGQGIDSAAIAAERNNNEVIFKNVSPFAGIIIEINNTKVDNVKDLDVVMLIYNSIIILQ